MDHLTHYLLFTPNPLTEREKQELMGGKIPRELFDWVRRSLRELIRRPEVRERVIEVYGVDPSAYL